MVATTAELVESGENSAGPERPGGGGPPGKGGGPVATVPLEELLGIFPLFELFPLLLPLSLPLPLPLLLPLSELLSELLSLPELELIVTPLDPCRL